MIVIILGGVIGVATIVYLSLQKPEQDSKKNDVIEEDNQCKEKSKVNNEQIQQKTQEEIEQAQKEFNKQKQEAVNRKERLLSRLTDKEREIFEGYINDMTKIDDKKTSSSSESFFIELLFVLAGLVFVYALVAILGNRFYTPFEIFDILKIYFVGIGGNQQSSQNQNSSPFIINNPSTSGQDL
ncbi:transmembrane protein, putative (macronuclear) [Tetrahymena thermophila SB210]|uniref:Transmembrane protein, putative n=1 Tax=Tetrahymena thermophila (strain SB210) TaxID=312017 RepID=Q22GG8_TETTS|nr:transmembrane protein, putative [Tetrahymena thermophila SB210]EAR84363.1 transmembrane protein, putative [Tetrahymena thermophila SB210]|eukprot:XP_001032026.1 transmembrane protein, putative [Tetrahymena thermophila SB210]